MEWINVKDRLPEFNKAVLVYKPLIDIVHGRIGLRTLAEYDPNGKWYTSASKRIDDVSHWMELPKAPQF